MSYISLTDRDREEMLKTIGASSIDDLFTDIPGSIQLNEPLDLPGALSEPDVYSHCRKTGNMNREAVSFLGAGIYQHYIPAAVDHLASRSEFYTAYTPYQAEVSQGTLAAVFEYQTFISRLTGMELANASLYDGATAMAEAAFMSVRSTKKETLVVSDSIHPNYLEVLRTYAWASDIKLKIIHCLNGDTDPECVHEAMDESVSAVIVQNPNFLGIIENIKGISAVAGNYKAHTIVAVNEPVSLGLLKPPGELGADIACGEAQGFGNPVGFGGPLLGFLSAKKEFMRKIPGRLIGKTTDLDGKESYVLTLQTREQHIRRERATSNICTNQGLCALRATIYLSLIGNRLHDLAKYNHGLASRVKKRLTDKGYSPVYDKPFFNEFVVKVPGAKEKLASAREKGVLAGLYLGDYFPDAEEQVLVCVTECNSAEDADLLVDSL